MLEDVERVVSGGKLLSVKKGQLACNVKGCPKEGYMYKHHYMLVKHNNKWHVGKTAFKCTPCNKFFANQANLDNHNKKHSGDKFQCPKSCGVEFTTQQACTRHVAQMHGPGAKSQGELRCLFPNCTKTFSKDRGLKEHEVRCKYNPERKTQDCTVCGKKCTSGGDFYRHMRNLHGWSKDQTE